jgi:hypothetical protein
MDSLEQKRKQAIEYLRQRKIYIVDEGNKFVPTSIAHTDVAATMARYRRQTEGVQLIREVHKSK